MSDLHFCDAKGSIVAPNCWLPTESFDYDWVIVGLFIGCNNLRCTVGGDTVRSWIDGAARKYACSCENDLIGYGGRSVAQPWNTVTEETVPWACAGHPSLALPATVDGVELRPDMDWKALARDTFTHAIDPSLHPDLKTFRGFLIQRIFNVVVEPHASAIAHAVSELLVDSDARVRAAAATFYRTNFMAAGAHRIAEVLRDQPELFVGVPDPDGEGTLWDWIAPALEARMASGPNGAPRDPLAREILKKRVLTPPGVGSSLHRLAMEERDWIVAHATQILDAAPARWTTVLYVLHGSAKQADVAREVVQRGYATDADVKAELAKPR